MGVGKKKKQIQKYKASDFMGGNSSVWAELCAVLGFKSLFGFSFDIALLPVLSLDLKQPLLKHFCSDRKSETDKTLCSSKDNPHQWIQH